MNNKRSAVFFFGYFITPLLHYSITPGKSLKRRQNSPFGVMSLGA